MKRASLLALVLIVCLGCQRRDAAVVPPPPPPPEPTSPHEFVIERGAVRYNGKPLRLRGPIETWLAAIGTPSRDIEYGDRFVTWDEIGVYLRVRDGLAREFGVYLQPHIPPIEPHFMPFLPTQFFTGRLVVDGWRVHKDVNPTEVRHHFADWRRNNLRRGYTYEHLEVEPPVAGHLDASGTGGTYRFELTGTLPGPKRPPLGTK